MKPMSLLWHQMWQKTLFGMAILAFAFASNADESFAKRSGGRVGGSSFRSSPKSSPSRSTPSKPNTSPNTSRSSSPSGSTSRSNYGGGGVYSSTSSQNREDSFFSYLVLLFVIVVIAAIVISAFKGNSNGQGITSLNSKVSVAKIQVGLLASARSLQQQLVHIALESDTSSTGGLLKVLQETVLALMRHPEYWVYVCSAKEDTNFDQAEQRFNGLVMSERSKLNEESLTNVKGRVLQLESQESQESRLETAINEDSSEYIVVTILLAVSGDSFSKMPVLRSVEELTSVLGQITQITEDNLLAIEVLWEPQSEEYTLTSDDLLSIYPDLIRI
jgi:uncharacterized membrane protein